MDASEKLSEAIKMNRRTFVKTRPAVTVLAGATASFGQNLQPIELPKPEKDGGKSVLAAWFHNCDRQNTITEFKLRPEQRVLFAPSVGYPENN